MRPDKVYGGWFIRVYNVASELSDRIDRLGQVSFDEVISACERSKVGNPMSVIRLLHAFGYEVSFRDRVVRASKKKELEKLIAGWRKGAK